MGMTQDGTVKALDDQNLNIWKERYFQLKKDQKRERWGLTYLTFSIVSIILGFSGLLYGIAGKDWIQKPYVLMGGIMIVLALLIVIGGFGRVKA